MSDISRTSVTSQVEFLEKIPCEKLKYRYNMKEPLKKPLQGKPGHQHFSETCAVGLMLAYLVLFATPI